MNEEKNQKVLAVILVIAVMALLGYKLFIEKNDSKSKIDNEKIELVKDNNRFFTVSSCVDKYFMYLNSKSTDELLILLNEKFKTDNNVNSQNLYSFVKPYTDFYGFITKKMYVQRLNENTYKYYVYGLIEKGTEDITKTYEDYYVIVILDESNVTFSVQPYDGEIFNK